jgi:serpin B
VRFSTWVRGALLVPVLLALLALASPAASPESARGVIRGYPARGSARPTAGLPPVAPGIGAFGLDVMRKLHGANLVFSPDSIADALAMAGSGAAGQTATQMAHVLKVPSPAAFAEVGQLQSSISAEQVAAGQGNPQAPTLEIADGLFLQEDFSLREPFLSGAQSSFGAVPQSVEFRGGGASAVAAINTWGSEHTHGLIPQILTSIPERTLLALVNAVYLKASWLHPFEASQTVSATFHGQHRGAAMPFMHETDQLPYSQGRGYSAVALPYQASTLSLLVVLPVGQSTTSLERRLADGGLAQIVDRLTTRPVALSLPRFQLEFHEELNRPLEELGMTDAFSEDANFSGIAAEPALNIGLVEHASDFSLDEQGTLATAATVVALEATSAIEFRKPIVQFDADRPFLFFLRDDTTGTLLFAGRLSEPGT